MKDILGGSRMHTVATPSTENESGGILKKIKKEALVKKAAIDSSDSSSNGSDDDSGKVLPSPVQRALAQSKVIGDDAADNSTIIKSKPVAKKVSFCFVFELTYSSYF